MDFPVNESEYKFLRDKHIKYCIRWLGVLPERCEGLDSTRPLSAFFALSTLDHLGALDQVETEKQRIINWLYSFQVTSEEEENTAISFGFRGSTLCMAGSNLNSDYCDNAHVAMTYTTLATLLVLGDDLSRVKKQNVLHSLRDLQLPDGSFRPMSINCESDMRFVYCVACVCYILQDWSSIDVQNAVDYIHHSINFDGGIGQGPGLESHGGSTYCAVAALWLMGRLDGAFTPLQLKNMVRWLIFRQNHGFHGRPNKLDDTCYSFWIGATLKLLGHYELVNYKEVSAYVFSAQDEMLGGIAKWVDHNTDIFHTFLGLSGLMLCDKGTPLVHPALNISQRAADHLAELHKQWQLQS